MSSLVRRSQIRIMKKRGIERGYAIRNNEIVRTTYPKMLQKQDVE